MREIQIILQSQNFSLVMFDLHTPSDRGIVSDGSNGSNGFIRSIGSTAAPDQTIYQKSGASGCCDILFFAFLFTCCTIYNIKLLYTLIFNE